MVSYPARRITIRNRIHKRPIPLRPPSSRNFHKRECLLVKGEVQYYEDYINLVELRYGKGSKESSVFKRLHRDCKEQRITVEEIKTRVGKLFKDQEKLVLIFSKTVMPYLYPLATKDQVDRANHFFHTVKLAFPKPQPYCASVLNLVLKFQDGRLTLKEMTVEMLKRLEYKDELIKAYMKFVPQSKNVVAGTIIRRRLSYLHLFAIIVALVLGFYNFCNKALCFCIIACVLVILY